MIEDHLGVVDEAVAAAEIRRSRLRELLDREILPCLERPGRQLGPYDLPLRAKDGPSNVALISLSVEEGVRAPAALRPLFENVAPLCEFKPGFASVPAEDLERMLARERLPLFTRPDWTALSDVPLWIVHVPEPLHLLGLVTVLRSARVPLRAHERATIVHSPVLVLTGEGAFRAGELACVHADYVIAAESLDAAWFARVGSSLQAGIDLRGAVEHAGLGERGRAGGLDAPLAESAVVDHDPGIESKGPRREEVAAFLVHGLRDLERPLRTRQEGRGDSFTDRFWIGSASAELRARRGFVDGATLARELGRSMRDEGGSVAIDVVWGLPGESAADRAALAPLLDAIVAAAPRGVRQVSARVGWYVPTSAERAEGHVCIDEAEALASLQDLRATLRNKRLRVDTSPAARAHVATVLQDGPAVLATVVERVNAAGARHVESPLACSAGLWRDALVSAGLESLWPVSIASGDEARRDATSVEPAPHGLGRVDAGADRTAPARSAHRGRRSASPEPRVDRWTRWRALVPQQFEVRVEFSKRGRARHLGPGEVTDVFLSALDRAGIALGSAGVAQPRPRISFGPVLPAGVAGERELVDLGLERPDPGLVEALRRELPEDFTLRGSVSLPPHGPQLALSQVAFAEYEVCVPADGFLDSESRRRSLERLHVWRERREQGSPCVDDPSDVLRQLHRLHVTEQADGALVLRFVLDLRDPGPKCKARDVVLRGLEGLVEDVRRLPLHRLRLLVLEEEPGRVVETTPFEQVLRARRRQRARAKFYD